MLTESSRRALSILHPDYPLAPATAIFTSCPGSSTRSAPEK